MIDYKELFVKYVRHVARQTDYEYGEPIGEFLYDSLRTSDFTDEEWIEARRLAGLPPLDPPRQPTAKTDPKAEEAEFFRLLRVGAARYEDYVKSRKEKE